MQTQTRSVQFDNKSLSMQFRANSNFTVFQNLYVLLVLSFKQKLIKIQFVLFTLFCPTMVNSQYFFTIKFFLYVPINHRYNSILRSHGSPSLIMCTYTIVYSFIYIAFAERIEVWSTYDWQNYRARSYLSPIQTLCTEFI